MGVFYYYGNRLRSFGSMGRKEIVVKSLEDLAEDPDQDIGSQEHLNQGSEEIRQGMETGGGYGKQENHD